MARTLNLRVIDYGDFTYADAGVHNFAVNISGAVTPPTASTGKITDLDYSTGYSVSPISGGFYPLVSESTARSVDVDVKAPNFPRYDNSGQIVDGTENTTQPAAPIFTYNTANVFGFTVNAQGLVTPPTASIGTITTESYSPGYLTGSYPPVTASITRSVDLDILVPQYYYNQFTEVTGSEFFIQAAFGVGVWSSAGNLLYTSFDGQSSGDKDSGLQFGGTNSPAPTYTSTTSEYNGSTWSLGGNLVANQNSHQGTGTQNATISAGGFGGFGGSKYVQSYNGSSWSTKPSLINDRTVGIAGGVQNAAIVAGGQLAGDPTGLITEEYNGNSWSTSDSLNEAQENGAGSGTSINNTFIVAGRDEPTSAKKNVFQEYDGISWGYGPTISTARFSLGGAGTTNAALAFGGNTTGAPTGITNITEEYNGSSWSTANNLITSRNRHAGSGFSHNKALAVGGIGPSGLLSSAEVYDEP